MKGALLNYRGRKAASAQPVVARGPLPLAAKLVACVFLASGSLSALDMVFSAAHGAWNFNPGIHGLLIAAGLLRRRRLFRVFALITVVLSLLGFPIAAAYFWWAPSVPAFSFFGRQVTDLPNWAAVVGCALGWLIALWEYPILQRPDVRRAFGLTEKV